MPCPYQYAYANDIQIKKYDFEEFSGICGRFGGKALIGIRAGYDLITEREVLSHELGHFISGTEDNIHFSKWSEQKADRCGREFLIPYDELISEIESDDWTADATVLACKFWVSVDTMIQRIKDVFHIS